MIVDLTLEEIIDLAIHSGIEIPKENIPSDDLDQVICITKCHPNGIKDDEGNIEHYNLVMYFEDCPEEGVIPLGSPTDKSELDRLKAECNMLLQKFKGDIEIASKRREAIEQERDQLKANNNRLRLAALNALHIMPSGDAKAELRDAYDATPEQTLTKHDAEVINQFIKEIDDLGSVVETGEFSSAWAVDVEEIKAYANQLRQKAQEADLEKTETL